eukprot:TRINITY_DN76768_c0_g1_i1.p1 TRINITY_DN76768_c0_g1~~TRINITY_DN76768_c0_g1_i1.p1  ORF type:complete len:212 (-),score=19.00 TRINITY_DN76768_c0_g1_i1:648-1283(-)
MEAPEQPDPLRERSAQLNLDPKMQEIGNAIKTSQEDSDVSNPTLHRASPSALRVAGCETIERSVTRVWRYSPEPLLVYRGSTPPACLIPEQSPERRESLSLQKDQAKLEWREQMNRSLKRLVLDVELATDDRLKATSHQQRCKRVDTMHEWYSSHRTKDMAQNKVAPPYLSFSKDSVVMPGSRRPTPMSLLNRSLSSPAVGAKPAGITPAG